MSQASSVKPGELAITAIPLKDKYFIMPRFILSFIILQNNTDMILDQLMLKG